MKPSHDSFMNTNVSQRQSEQSHDRFINNNALTNLCTALSDACIFTNIKYGIR